MKAKFINEENFTRGDIKKSLDVGKKSKQSKEWKLKELLKKDVLASDNFIDGIIENIFELEKLIEKLVSAGITYKNIILSRPNSLRIAPTYQVLSSNTVIAECLIYEDAQYILDALVKFSLNRTPETLTIGKDRTGTILHLKDNYDEFDPNIFLKQINSNREVYKEIH